MEHTREISDFLGVSVASLEIPINTLIYCVQDKNCNCLIVMNVLNTKVSCDIRFLILHSH